MATIGPPPTTSQVGGAAGGSNGPGSASPRSGSSDGPSEAGLVLELTPAPLPSPTQPGANESTTLAQNSSNAAQASETTPGDSADAAASPSSPNDEPEEPKPAKRIAILRLEILLSIDPTNEKTATPDNPSAETPAAASAPGEPAETLTKIAMRLPIYSTLEAVKFALIKSQPSLFAVEPRDLSIGLSQNLVFTNEKALFLDAHEFVREEFELNQVIKVVAFPTVQRKRVKVVAPPPEPPQEEPPSLSGILKVSQLFMKPGVIKDGLLFKKMKYSNKYEPRRFELQIDNVLYYFKLDQTEPLGKIPLAITSLIELPGRPDAFQLEIGTKKILVQGKEGEVREWIEILNRSIKEAKELYLTGIDMEGWLMKRGAGVRSWKKRWCILKVDTMYYFEDDAAAKVDFTTHKGTISLQDSLLTADEDRQYGLKLHTPERIFFIQALSEEDMRKWSRAINLARKKLKEALQHSRTDSSVAPQPFPEFDWANVKKVTHKELDQEVAQHVSLPRLKRMIDAEQYLYVRYFFYSLRRFIENDRDSITRYIAVAPVTIVPLPLSFPESFEVKFRFKEAAITQMCKATQPWTDVVGKCISLLVRRNIVKSVSVDEMIIKLGGRRLFILDFSLPLHSITYIREQLTRGKKRIEVFVLDKNEVLANAGVEVETHAEEHDQSKPKELLQKMKRDFKIFLKKKTAKVLASASAATGLHVPSTQPEPVTTSVAIEEKEEQCFSVNDLPTKPFALRIINLENFSHSLLGAIVAEEQMDMSKITNKIGFFVDVGLYYGGKLLGQLARTNTKLTPHWAQVLNLGINYGALPAETRLCFTFYCNYNQKNSPLAWVNCPITDHTGKLKKGHQLLSMWLNDKAKPLGTCEMNHYSKIILRIEFEETPLPIVFDSMNAPVTFMLKQRSTTMLDDRATIQPDRSPPTSPRVTSPRTTMSPASAILQGIADKEFKPRDSRRHSILIGRPLSANAIPDDKRNCNDAFSPRSTSGGYPSTSSPEAPQLAASPPASSPTQSLSTSPTTTAGLGGEDSEGAGLLKPMSSTARMRGVHRPEINRILKYDPLVLLSDTEKELVWGWRRHLTDQPDTLPKILLSANMLKLEHRQHVQQTVRSAPLMSPYKALELLDYKFPDTGVRDYAVRCINQLADEELALFLLQLVQVLKYEPFHVSSLSCFLIDRALRNPLGIGQPLFWHLQAELQNPEVAARFGFIKEALLSGFQSELRKELLDQVDLVAQLTKVSEDLSKVPPQNRTQSLRELLQTLTLSPRFVLPLSSTMVARGLVLDKCKVMDSASFPLWLVFENDDVGLDPICVMFKRGDDLRQDSLTLQMFSIMDRLWKAEGLDMQMSVYGCVSTGDCLGMLEIVTNAQTTAKIQKEAGGVMGALMKTPLHNWLSSHNPSENQMRQAVEIFTSSCAAYCVGTYVLGIGDRHNDNIMVTNFGHLFHIDFAHFLGNVMKFGLYTRERAPFVLTPEFIYVMGGDKSEQYLKFKDLCANLYNKLRSHANVFINLFAMMLFTGIPQLQTPEDIAYLKKAFSLTLSDVKAGEVFERLIDESLDCKATQLNFALHILAHPS